MWLKGGREEQQAQIYSLGMWPGKEREGFESDEEGDGGGFPSSRARLGHVRKKGGTRLTAGSQVSVTGAWGHIGSEGLRGG